MRSTPDQIPAPWSWADRLRLSPPGARPFSTKTAIPANARHLMVRLPARAAIQQDAGFGEPAIVIRTSIRPTEGTIVLDLLCSKYRTKPLNDPNNSGK